MSTILRCAAIATLAVLALPAQAATVVDQSQLQYNLGMPFGADFGSGPFYNLPVGQTYTAGITSTLASVTVYCNGACSIDELGNTLTMTIYDGAGLGGTVLGTATHSAVGVIDPTLLLRALTFDFASAGIAQTAGSGYAFAVTSITGPGDIGVRGILQRTGNPYTAGAVTPTPFYGSQPDWDLMFKTEVAAVPEPASWATMIAGFALIGVATRRRRAAIA